MEGFREFVHGARDAIFRFEHRPPVPMALSEDALVDRILSSSVLADANPAFVRLYGGADLREFLARPLEGFGGGEANRQLVRAFVRAGFRLDDLEWQVEIAGAARWFRGSFRGELRDGFLHGVWGMQTDITERKGAELELRTSEQRYRALVDLTADFYWQTDAEHRFVFREGQVLQHMGLPPASDYGKTRWELEFLNISPADWDAHRALLARREEFRDLLLARRGADGRTHWASMSGRPLFDDGGRFLGYHGTGREVTRQVEAEQALRESEARFRSLAMLSSDWYWEQDTEFRFTSVSGDIVSRTGISSTEHLGRTRWELPALNVAPAQWAAHRAQLEARRPFRDFVLRRPDRDGREHWVSISGEPMFDAEGRFAGYRGVGRDVTDAVRAEQEILRLNESLEQRVRERTAALEAAMRELEAFSYSVSHDLRAPLRAIGGFARLLAEDDAARLSAKGREMLGVVEHNAQRMGELIDALLMLARVSRTEIRRTELDLAQIVDAVAAELRRSYPSAELAVGPLPAARGDAALLRQAVVNLLQNAFKYSARAAAPRVQVGWSEPDGAYFVRDNGVGFDMAQAGRLFVAFQRLHPEAEFAGSGIGLAIVERVVRRHGGRIWAMAAPDAGATFYFTLPS